MSLFGFVYSEEKLAPFDYTAEILGVVVDLSKASQRIFLFPINLPGLET